MDVLTFANCMVDAQNRGLVAIYESTRVGVLADHPNLPEDTVIFNDTPVHWVFEQYGLVDDEEDDVIYQPDGM
jgi:hypothetical protein